ncbi:aldo/keto reductase [Ruania rhizosphaerae]|uniref:aldo/keto reductase n=1 Tax=Ruania rhizosphaerae TaxID=1840413 RepID=UPI00135CACDA|nr:aldo/keto reductase [Ruania rhizosphaerae]
MPGPATPRAFALRELGSTGLKVTAVTAGTAGWQDRADGTGPSAEQTAALASLILSGGGVRVLDTSNNYGFGESERRIGAALRTHPDTETVLVQTKADRDWVSGTFSYERMQESVRESCERLGLDRIPMCFLHDPENASWGDITQPQGPLAALLEMRDAGSIGHLGISGGPAGLLRRYLGTGHFEAVMTHNRYTLVDRSADLLLDEAAAAGVGVYNAAPYGGGLLAAWPSRRRRYAYGDAAPALLAAVDIIGQLLEEADVPIAAASLQWSLRDPRVTSTVVGMLGVEEHEKTVQLADVVIEDRIWEELEQVELDDSTWQDPPERR